MSSLQLGLIVAGVLLVVAVIIYNVWQERRLKRSLARTRAGADAVTPGVPLRTAQRVEPTLGAPYASGPAAVAEGVPAFGGDSARASADVPLDVIAPPASFDTTEDVPVEGMTAEIPAALARARLEPEGERNASVLSATHVRHAARHPIQPDHEIESLIPLQPAAPVVAGALAAGLHARIGKPLRWFGRADPRADWARLTSDTPGRFAEIVACLLLADRNGAASRAMLDTFARVVGDIAQALPAQLTLPDFDRELSRAESLDRLCAELDVQIGLTVQMPESASIAGTRLRGVAEAAGFRLAPGGRFEFVQDETGVVLYTLQNLRPDPFSAEMLRLTATNGVVLLLDVARLADPVRVFDQMKLAARRLAQNLGAELVDDNQRLLDDAALARIREQVGAAADALRAVHIEPGSARAMALFGA
jgi:Cell division protein